MNYQFFDVLDRFCYKNQCHTIITTGQPRVTRRVNPEHPICGSNLTVASSLNFTVPRLRQTPDFSPTGSLTMPSATVRAGGGQRMTRPPGSRRSGADFEKFYSIEVCHSAAVASVRVKNDVGLASEGVRKKFHAFPIDDQIPPIKITARNRKVSVRSARPRWLDMACYAQRPIKPHR